MVEFTVPLVLDIIRTAGILVGIVYYLIIMRNSQRNQQIQLETRQAQLFMQIYNRFSDREMTRMQFEFMSWEWEDYDDWERKYESNVDALSLRASLGAYYEGIGVLIKMGLIDPTLVDNLMSTPILLYWRKFEPVIRRRSGYPQRAEYQEYLYNQILAIAEKQHPELKT
jgi:hypothetical protein